MTPSSISEWRKFEIKFREAAARVGLRGHLLDMCVAMAAHESRVGPRDAQRPTSLARDYCNPFGIKYNQPSDEGRYGYVVMKDNQFDGGPLPTETYRVYPSLESAAENWLRHINNSYHYRKAIHDLIRGVYAVWAPTDPSAAADTIKIFEE